MVIGLGPVLRDRRLRGEELAPDVALLVTSFGLQHQLGEELGMQFSAWLWSRSRWRTRLCGDLARGAFLLARFLQQQALDFFVYVSGLHGLVS